MVITKTWLKTDNKSTVSNRYFITVPSLTPSYSIIAQCKFGFPATADFRHCYTHVQCSHWHGTCSLHLLLLKDGHENALEATPCNIHASVMKPCPAPPRLLKPRTPVYEEMATLWGHSNSLGDSPRTVHLGSQPWYSPSALLCLNSRLAKTLLDC